MHVGLAHEEAVADELRSRGWHVEHFGQGLFSERIHDALRAQRPVTHLRWLPDLIVCKRRDSGEKVALVECKSGLSDTPNHAIEIDCWMAGLMCQRLWHIPVVIVWSDMTVNTLDRIRPVRWELAPRGVNGSGTPFVLVAKADQYPINRWFGLPHQDAA
jgi:hypothetical protein